MAEHAKQKERLAREREKIEIFFISPLEKGFFFFFLSFALVAVGIEIRGLHLFLGLNTKMDMVKDHP